MRPDRRAAPRPHTPFTSLQQEAFLRIARADAALREGVERLLAAHDLTLAQYNVLRVLRGAPADGLCRNEIRDRLVDRMPDVTRLLDRMQDAGLVRRVRSSEDRRLVHTTLTAKGRKLVDALDDPIQREHARQFAQIDTKQLKALVELLAAL